MYPEFIAVERSGKKTAGRSGKQEGKPLGQIGKFDNRRPELFSRPAPGRWAQDFTPVDLTVDSRKCYVTDNVTTFVARASILEKVSVDPQFFRSEVRYLPVQILFRIPQDTHSFST